VTDEPADLFERHPGRVKRRDEAVPEIVDPEPLDPGGRQKLLEVVRGVPRAERPAVDRREDERPVADRVDDQESGRRPGQPEILRRLLRGQRRSDPGGQRERPVAGVVLTRR
jgi:hypothetical protein